MKRILTIAGSDSGGGAGIQADLKTFHQFGCYGMSVITAVTAQNTQGVHAVEILPASFVSAQIKAVFDDIGVDVIKTGMLATADLISEIAAQLKPLNIPIIVDPVMRAKGGAWLLEPDAVSALQNLILPIATLVTPNIPEAEALAAMSIRSLDEMKTAARTIYAAGAKHVLVKGGHLKGEALDLLFDGDDFKVFVSPRLKAKHTHGTGCTYSAAIAANLANGHALHEAIEVSKNYITEAIRSAFEIGKGIGPVNHFVQVHG